MHCRSNVRAILLALSLLVLWPAESSARGARMVEGDPIDIVISLDVSGTMKGLIDTTRVKIWEIVNDLAQAEPTPRLRVALITFGNPSGSRETGWVRVETDLTEDLDLVSQRLFQLQSRGADEMLGRVLQTALEGLTWSESEYGLKLHFIAGNESADQDPDARFREWSQATGNAGIFVTAIYCGTENEADAASWKEMAELAHGRFSTIDHHARATVVATPHDKGLVELGDLMNETFIPLGKEGAEQKRTRAKQDKNARRLGLSVAATRAQTKGSPFYSSRSDMVSLHQSGELDFAQVDARDLPRPMGKMTIDERFVFLEDMQVLRDEIRERIASVSAKRRQFVSERRAELGMDDSRSFDRVVRRTIREKAEDIGFSFPDR